MGQIDLESPTHARYAAGFTTTLHRDLGRDADPDAAMRACVDLPVTVRMHGLRLIAFSAAILHAQSAEARQSAQASWDRAMDGYLHTASCFHETPNAALHESVRRLLAEVLPHEAASVKAIREYVAVAEGIRRAAESQHVTTEYDQLMEYVYATYTPALMALEQRLAHAVETHFRDQRRTAKQAQARAQAARAKIEGIARTVRMIALNARVEAARAGEAGRAFDLIASEIHQLSERASEASAEMGSSIEAILNRRADRASDG